MKILSIYGFYWPYNILLVVGIIGFLSNIKNKINFRFNVEWILSTLLMIKFLSIIWQQSYNPTDYNIILMLLIYLNILYYTPPINNLILILAISSLLIFISYVVEIGYKSFGVISPIQNTFFLYATNYDASLSPSSNARPVGVMGKKYLTTAYALLFTFYIYATTKSWYEKYVVTLGMLFFAFLIQAYIYFFLIYMVCGLFFIKNKKIVSYLILMTLFILMIGFFIFQYDNYIIGQIYYQLFFFKNGLWSLLTSNLVDLITVYKNLVFDDYNILIFGGSLNGSYHVGGDFGFVDFIYINGVICTALSLYLFFDGIRLVLYNFDAKTNIAELYCVLSILYLLLSLAHYYIFLDINFIYIFILILVLKSNHIVKYNLIRGCN